MARSNAPMPYDEPLSVEQMRVVQEKTDKLLSNQDRQQRAVADHALRVRCVEQAIKAIDACPNVAIENRTEHVSYASLDVTYIAKEIYDFVNVPLAELDK